MDNNIENKKKLSPNIILCVIMVLIVGGLVGYIVYDIINDNKTTTPATVSSETSSTTNNEASNTDNNNTTAFDGTKCINQPSYTYKLSGTVNNNSGIVNGSINTDKKSATLVVSLSTYKNAQFLTNTNLENEEQVTLKVQLNGIIKSIYFDGSEQSPGYETAYFLMEDGTLYYAYIFEKVNSMKSASDNVITVTIAKGISDVKEIKNGETVGELVNTTALAIKNDGTFYDLGYITNDANPLNY